jgi:pyruvate kinase
MIQNLILDGMAVCRLNLAHCSRAFAEETIALIRKIRQDLATDAHVAIWLDINGPKVRSVLFLLVLWEETL